MKTSSFRPQPSAFLAELDRPALTLLPARAPVPGDSPPWRPALKRLERRLLALEKIVRYQHAPEKRQAQVDAIIAHVANHYGYPVAALINHARGHQHLALVRQVAMALALRLTRLPAATIALHFRREHSNITYAQRKITDLCSIDPQLNTQVQTLTQQLTERLKAEV